jgi:glycosyltransferase involved in cell wall biosynthesis
MYSFREQWLLRKIPREHTLLTCHYTAPLLFRGRLVATVLDLAHLDLPDCFPGVARRFLVRCWIGRVLRRAALVLTISGFSRARIAAVFGEGLARKCRVVYAPAKRLPDPEPGYAPVPGPFVLHVGNRKPHKNLAVLVEGFAAFFRRNPGSTLVLAGEGASYASHAAACGIPAAHFVELSGVGDARLAALYRQAACLCLPSRYEGFGLPPLEALACGTPVVLSDIPVLHEIAGDAALYFPPDDPQALAATLERAIAAGIPVDPAPLLDYFSQEAFRARLLGALAELV